MTTDAPTAAVVGGPANGLTRGAPQRVERTSPFAIEPAPGGDGPIRFSGTFAFRDAAAVWEAARGAVSTRDWGGDADLDLTDVRAIDGSTMALLVALRSELRARGVRSDFVGASGHVAALVQLYRGDLEPRPLRRRTTGSVLAHVGRATAEIGAELRGVIGVIGFLRDMGTGAPGILRAPRTPSWRQTLPLLGRAGADAVPIVTLISFLAGFVMALQGAAQLKQLGASTSVAALVGLSVTRELGPLLTAIIVCARSGAAYAAELGAMRVSEEIDALRTLGLGPVRFLVFPRTLALILVMPVLTLLADIVGITGGLVEARLSRDLTFNAYLAETLEVVDLGSVGSGLLKSVAFAFTIGILSCQQGLATTGGAQGVGRRTTSAVVSTLFTLVLLDAAFTLAFHHAHP